MRISLVGAEIEENLSIRYLASSLRRAGHEAVIVPFDGPSLLDGVAEEIVSQRPGLVGLSMVNQMRASEHYSLARRLRSLGYRGHITVGGHFPTFTYEEMLADCPSIDSVVRHDGEVTIVELASSLENGGNLSAIEGLVYRTERGIACNAARKPEGDLDSLPFPARDGSPRLHLGVPTATIVGSRGCYGNCSFCCINAWHKGSGGAKYRMRSPENLVSEMAYLYHERGVRIFIFHDDNFFLPKREDSRVRIEEIGRLMGRQGIKDAGLVVKYRPNDVDRELFAYLKELGLIRVYVGIETNAVAGLRTLNRRVSKNENRRALEILRELDIYACFNVLIFDPESTLEDIGENVEFLREHDYYPFNFCRTEAYAHTPMQDRLLAEGRLKGNYLLGTTIADPRTELLFRICAVAFWERNFTDNGLANRNVALGYQVQVLKWLYPAVYDSALAVRTEDLVRRINLDTLRFLEKARDFSADVDFEDTQAMVSFAASLARDIACRNLLLGDEITVLERDIRDATVRKPRAKQLSIPLTVFRNLPGRAAAASVASALFLAACDYLPTPATVPTDIAQCVGESVTTTPDPALQSYSVKMEATGANPTETGDGVRQYGWRVQADLIGPDGSVGLPEVHGSYLQWQSIVRSPDGRHMSFVVNPSAAPSSAEVQEGPTAVRVRFPVSVSVGGEIATRAVAGCMLFYVYKDRSTSVGATPEATRITTVDPVPAPTLAFAPDKPVVIRLGYLERLGQPSSQSLGLRARLDLEALLSDTVAGGLQGLPDITASTGDIRNVGSGGSRRVVFTFVPPMDNNERLTAGPITVKVTFKMLDNGQLSSYTGELHLNIDEDGNMRIVDNQQSMADPVPSLAVAMLPMRSRFGLEILCRDLGDGRLELTGKPSGVDERTLRYRWTTEDGQLSKSGGATTIWQPVSNGGHQQVQLAAITLDADLVVVSRDVAL